MSDLAADFARILDGETSFEETKAFLVRSIDLMGDAAALAAGAQALRERMIAVSAPAGAIDVCGTGGDGAHTLNISTAVAFVVAGAGVPVAKHGNRAMSSKSGAADVLEALGVKLTGHVPTLERCLREAGVAFLFAQNHHPAMRHVAAARRELGVRTIFNLLGPLANPARVKRQLVGVFSADYLAPIAAALRAIGGERAIVVHGAGGLDELSFIAGGANQAVLLTQDGAVARCAGGAPPKTPRRSHACSTAKAFSAPTKTPSCSTPPLRSSPPTASPIGAKAGRWRSRVCAAARRNPCCKRSSPTPQPRHD
jgi:anthranilate phosphoribosyltransferase